jgi:hypothetical protein
MKNRATSFSISYNEVKNKKLRDEKRFYKSKFFGEKFSHLYESFLNINSKIHLEKMRLAKRHGITSFY